MFGSLYIKRTFDLSSNFVLVMSNGPDLTHRLWGFRGGEDYYGGNMHGERVEKIVNYVLVSSG